MGRISSKFYSVLPVSIQNLAVSAYGYQWKKRRFGGIFEAELRAFKERENYTAEQWVNYETTKLRELLIHAYQTVPYYQSSFKNASLSLDSLRAINLETISRLPLLEKNDLRLFGKSRLVSTRPEKGGEYFASSGSTGTPTQILFSHPMHQRWSAGFEARIRHWADVDRFTPRGMIGGRRVVPDADAKRPYYRYNFFEKQTYFSAYHISQNTVDDYLAGMIRNNVRYMTGYAMSNYFLARFIEESNLRAPNLQAVITSSEKLTQEMRDTFRKVYQCKSYDSWSGVEACGLVSECEHGSLHISPDMGIIELLDENGNPVKPGDVGEVVCTGLLNYDQPLIRYRIGDSMRLGDKECSCGRSLPVITEIMGRMEDLVTGKDGREMVRFHGVFVDLPNLIEGQIIQWDLQNIEIMVVTNGSLTLQEEEVIRRRVTSQLNDIQITIRQVDSIPRGANGKFKAVISHVNRNTIKSL